MKEKTQYQMTVVSGQPGTGKTTFIKQELVKLHHAVIVDPMDEFADDPGVGLATMNRREFGGYIQSHAKDRHCKVVYTPEDQEDFASLCTLNESLAGFTFSIDEVDRYVSAVSVPEQLKRLCRYYRHFKLDIIVATRRPAAIPREITACAMRFVLFRHVEPRDVSYFRGFIGKTALQLPDLPPFTAICWDRGEVYKIRLTRKKATKM
jgi:hypothetical protein